MVQDVNPPSFARSASKFRKAGKDNPKAHNLQDTDTFFILAGEFRDNQLLDICETAFKTLEELVQHGIVFTSSTFQISFYRFFLANTNQ